MTLLDRCRRSDPEIELDLDPQHQRPACLLGRPRYLDTPKRRGHFVCPVVGLKGRKRFPFPSIKAAAEAMGVKRTTLHEAIRGGHHTAGMRWRYRECRLARRAKRRTVAVLYRGIRYESIKDAASALGVPRWTIENHLGREWRGAKLERA